MKYVAFVSGGNDSCALIQWAYEKGLKDLTAVYTDTGWSGDRWQKRMLDFEFWVQSLGYEFVRIDSEGMKSLVRRKKAWPRGGGGKYQFCTENLKEKPAREWLDKMDPERESICMVGIRRSESANRVNFPEHTDESEKHGFRDLWAPLVRHTDEMRNELLVRAGWDVLPTRSKECDPCVNANQKELKLLSADRIDAIELLENEMGVNSKGNARVMFSPSRHGGASGIRAVVDDAQKNNDDLFNPKGCDGGWCGD